MTNEEAQMIWADKQLDGEWGLLQPLFWPRYTRMNPAWNQRLGRVVHWLFTVIMIACFAVGIVDIWDSRARIEGAHKAWEQRHMKQYVNVPPIGTKDATKGITYTDVDYAPDANDPEPQKKGLSPYGLLMSVGVGIVFMLIGRGFRYIVGGE